MLQVFCCIFFTWLFFSFLLLDHLVQSVSLWTSHLYVKEIKFILCILGWKQWWKYLHRDSNTFISLFLLKRKSIILSWLPIVEDIIPMLFSFLSIIIALFYEVFLLNFFGLIAFLIPLVLDCVISIFEPIKFFYFYN